MGLSVSARPDTLTSTPYIVCRTARATMVKFTRFVEVGRVVLIERGDNAGKLATIVDFKDINNVLVDGPESVTGVKRQVVNLKSLALTMFKINIRRGQSGVKLDKAFQEANVVEQWKQTAWAKRRDSRARRTELTDFERFKAHKLRATKAKIIRKAALKLVK